MKPNRRQFMAAGATAAAAAPAMAQAQAPTPGAPRPGLIRPRRLQGGDTLALINPSGAIYERAPYEIATETMQALGFKVREAPNHRAIRT